MKQPQKPRSDMKKFDMPVMLAADGAEAVHPQ